MKEQEALWTMSYTSVMHTTDQKAAKAEVNAIVRAARLKARYNPVKRLLMQACSVFATFAATL